MRAQLWRSFAMGQVARCGLAAALGLTAAQSAAAGPERVAVFDFDLINTSPAPSTPEERARLQRLDAALRQGLAEPGRYAVVSTETVRDKIAHYASIRACNGCEVDLARGLGAEFAAYGWVQKVSNLILNINVVVEDVKTGQTVHAESVDIRGNTDESWTRGLRYLLDERMFRKP